MPYLPELVIIILVGPLVGDLSIFWSRVRRLTFSPAAFFIIASANGNASLKDEAGYGRACLLRGDFLAFSVCALALGVCFFINSVFENRHVILPNVPHHLSLLAFGIPPAREAESAGGMPKVPKGQGLGACARSAIFYFALGIRMTSRVTSIHVGADVPSRCIVIFTVVPGSPRSRSTADFKSMPSVLVESI